MYRMIEFDIIKDFKDIHTEVMRKKFVFNILTRYYPNLNFHAAHYILLPFKAPYTVGLKYASFLGRKNFSTDCCLYTVLTS